MDDTFADALPAGLQVIPLQAGARLERLERAEQSGHRAISAPGQRGGDPAQGFAKAVEMCNNNGHCRKFDAGTMCPSYRVTRTNSTSRAGAPTRCAWRCPASSGPEGLDPRRSEAMDLCVSCKGCKRDCPTGVDMARMKVEVKSARRMAKGLSWRDRLIGATPSMAPYARRMPWLFNAAWFVQSYLGFAKQRRLPQWRGRHVPVDHRSRRQRRHPGDLRRHLLEQFEPEILHAARRVLTAAGHRVAVAWPTLGAPALCCGRTYLATGQVERARGEALRTLNALRPFAQKGVPIIGLEPSCLFTLRDEFLALGLGEDAEQVAAHAMLFEEFLAREKKAGRLDLALKPLAEKSALLHGHCHQKAFGAMSAVQEALALVPDLTVTPIESSCCGMAGSFGYEAEHYETSIAMAELSLLPAVRKADAGTLVVADGTSCRHQIADGADRPAIHVAQVLERAPRCLITCT
jgi:Fe-S oxidoreductase